jgi:uracil-DNA glycosylase
MLWGNKAQELQRQAGSVAVLKTSHPSPLSAYRGFLGSNIFIECNEKLRQLNLPEIEWLKK